MLKVEDMKQVIVITAKSTDNTSRTLQRMLGLFGRHCINITTLNISLIANSSMSALDIVVTENRDKVCMLLKKLESLVGLKEVKVVD